MRFKPVPEPPGDLAALETVLAAVPEPDEAAGVDDCCVRLVDRTPLETGDEAATWLTFLRALDLVADRESGYVRRVDPGRTTLEMDALRRAFRDHVYGAADVLDALDRRDGPTDVAAIADVYCRELPVQRRKRVAEDRVRRLLEWAVPLGLAARDDDGFRATDAARADDSL